MEEGILVDMNKCWCGEGAREEVESRGRGVGVKTLWTERTLGESKRDARPLHQLVNQLQEGSCMPSLYRFQDVLAP